MEETTVEVILFLHKTNHLPRIAHARNKGERRIVNRTQRLLVDGYDAQTRTAYEFSRMFLHKSPADDSWKGIAKTFWATTPVTRAWPSS